MQLLSPLHLHFTEVLTACRQDGQLVTFTEMEGIPEFNGSKPWRIKNVKVILLQLCAEQPIRTGTPCCRPSCVLRAAKQCNMACKLMWWPARRPTPSSYRTPLGARWHTVAAASSRKSRSQSSCHFVRWQTYAHSFLHQLVLVNHRPPAPACLAETFSERSIS